MPLCGFRTLPEHAGSLTEHPAVAAAVHNYDEEARDIEVKNVAGVGVIPPCCWTVWYRGVPDVLSESTASPSTTTMRR